MPTQTTEDRLREFVVDQLVVSPEQVTRNASVRNDLGSDSLDEVELVMQIEDYMDVYIPEEKMHELSTFGALVDFVESEICKK